jgi:hypothetical protein
VREVMPEKTAAAPSSARTTCANESASSLPAGSHVQAQAELVGHRSRRAEESGLVAEQPGDALLERLTVGSSPKTSSPTSASAIACRMPAWDE